MGWGKYTIDGVEHDLAHLDPILIQVTPNTQGAAPLKVLVSFGLHCFAREVRQNDNPKHLIRNGADVRCFCPERAAQSQNLPAIIRAAPNAPAFFSQETKMLLIEELPGLKGPYAVFFDIKRSSSPGIDAAMFVASAYEKDRFPAKFKAIPFRKLVEVVSAGEPVYQPKRFTRWKKK